MPVIYFDKIFFRKKDIIYKLILWLANSFISNFILIAPAEALAIFHKDKAGDILELMTPIYAYGMSTMEEDWTGTIELTKVMLTTALTVEGLKALKLEKRPNNADRFSFPSGHAASAFAAARYVHKRYGLKKAIVPYAMAIVTGGQRIISSAHFPHDVVAGAFIGGLINELFVTPYLPKNMSFGVHPQKVALQYNVSF